MTDLKVVEAILSEVGRAVRLFRYYPPSHPSAQRVLLDLGAVLPSLEATGAIEAQVGPRGFEIDGVALAPRSEPLRDLAMALHAQGRRTLVIEPGATPQEVAALVRALLGAAATAGMKLGVVPKLPSLPHIRLDVPLAARPGADAAAWAASTPPPETAARSTGLFRSETLPLELETRRVIEQLRHTPPEYLLASVGRLASLGGQLAAARDFDTLCEVLAALEGLAAVAAEPMVREGAAEAVAGLTSSETVQGVVAYLATPALTPEERARGIAATSALGDAALAALVAAYLATADAEVREACTALIERAGGRVVPLLAQRLPEPRADVAAGIATLLGATGSNYALALLLPLAQAPDASVRAAAVAALGRVGGAGAARAVRLALRDADVAVRVAAAQASQSLGDRSASPSLIARLDEEAEPAVQCALATALGALGETTAVAALAALADAGGADRREASVRRAAVHALAALATPEALGALARFRDDAVPEVRAAALQALG